MSFYKFIISKSFVKQVLIAIVSSVIFILALKWWLNETTNHNQKIQVPDLHGFTINEVKTKLDEINLNFIVIDSASYNPKHTKKSVIEQVPEAGNFVKEKRKIYLTINPSKYREVTIPDLNSKTKRQATSQLRSIGLKINGKSEYIKDLGKDVVRGLKVDDKKIEPGDKIPKNTKVTLILGDGKGGK